MEYKLPIYDISIDENFELGVDTVGLVSKPAMESEWVALAEQEQIKLAQLQDEQLLIGAALIPDKLIYRYNDKTKEEYYIKFSKETIKKIVDRYFKKGNQINFNLEHNALLDVNATVNESWIIEDSAIDKSALYGFNYPVGTWMLSVHVDDKAYWDEYVKTGLIKGFSIEGGFVQELVELSKISLLEPKTGESQDEFMPRCIAYHIDKEGMDADQAAAICYTKFEGSEEQLRVGEKIGYDYDGTLTTRAGKEMARKDIRDNSSVYIVSARSDKDGMLAVANQLGIPESRVYATGSNNAKVDKVKEVIKKVEEVKKKEEPPKKAVETKPKVEEKPDEIIDDYDDIDF
jgi:hypothetical protein